MYRGYYTEPYLEGVCQERDGLFIFNGDYTYGIGGTCLAAKVDYAKKWWYKHDTGIGVMASRFRPLYPEPDIQPLQLPKHMESPLEQDITLPASVFVGIGLAAILGFAILMKIKI